MGIFNIFDKKKATLFSGSTGIASLFGISHGRTGGPATIDQALETSIVFAAARVIAEGVAQMPLNLIEETENGDIARTRIAKDHPAHRLMSKRPNSWMTSFEFIEGMVFSAVLGRAALAIKVQVGKEVREPAGRTPAIPLIERNPGMDVEVKNAFENNMKLIETLGGFADCRPPRPSRARSRVGPDARRAG